MYHRHFGLRQSPFGITPNPAFFFTGNTRGAMLDALLYAVLHGEGIVKVSGEVGSGKTMLCRMLESQLPAHVEVIYLANPSLSRHEVVYAIAGELALDVNGRRVDEVLRALHQHLIDKHAQGKQVLLLVEEAQAMPLDTLEEIRLLSNLETAHNKLLQIVLFGQPELDEHLDLPHMRQLKERITHSFVVPAMPADVIPAFLAFRMQAAGHAGDPVFSAGAVRLISAVSRGIVRRINILADKALMAAFADDAPTVLARHVKAAIRDSAFGTPALFDRRSGAIAALLLACLGGAGWWIARLPPAVAARAPTLAAAPAQTLLQQCGVNSVAWLNAQPDSHLSLQIVAVPLARAGELEALLQSMRSAVGLQQVHAYRIRLKGQDQMAVAYGSFASRPDAKAVGALLAAQWGWHGQIRELPAIRADVAAAGLPL